MATDFSYGGKQILSGGPFKPSGKDMPSDARTRVESYADIASIPNPHVGLKITVKVDETNNNKMTDYIVKSLKANSSGIANSVVDQVQRYVDYLGISTGGSSSSGTGSTIDTSNLASDLSLTGTSLQLKNSQGNLIGNAITLPSTSGGTSETVTVVRDIYANNEMPKMYVTSDKLGTLAGKADGTADCEVEIRFNRQIIKCYATGAVQGTSSASLPAKNYTFKFYSDTEHTTKNKIDVGWGKQSKYCFKKNYIDSTHTRNLSGARIAYDMVNSRPESDFKNNLLTAPRNGAVDGFPCVIYLNGEFWGLYT